MTEGREHTGFRWLIFCAFCLSTAVAQTKEPLRSSGIPADTARAVARDSLGRIPDTVKAVQSPSGIDSVVAYAATDSIIYSLSDKTMYLFGKGNIKYKELGLKAEKIDINWNTSVLFAQGVPDTADTTGKKYRGLPDLVDGNETYHGSTVAYNFKSKKGKIDLGKTEIEKGLYYGEDIKKVDTDVLFVGDGKFTTCDLEHPHYYFGSPEMKVLVKDKVIARPVYLYIADVPVFALPFGIFPSERGRRSGLIPPAYGESDRGRYLTHLGYYWAMNDYMDWNVRADGYTRGSYTLYSDYRYALRYNFSGGISGSYGRVVSGEPGDPAYSDSRVFNLHIGHAQDFNPTTRLFVDMTFSSGSYYQQTSTNLGDLLRQNIISNATLSKSWEGTPNSMSLNFHRDQNLQAVAGSVEVSEILPSISFNRTQVYPFRPDKRAASSGEMAWYELIGYTYGGQFENTRTVTKLAEGSNIDERRGFQHHITVNASPKVGYFTITPFFNYTELWYDKYITRGLNRADSVITADNKAITPVRYYNLGVSASTKFFGIFQPGVFGIKAIRHQVIPSLSYTYQPDFSKDRYGYYGKYTDSSGVVQKYSHYEREIFGGAPAFENQLLSLNVQNIFEMKTASTDTSGQDNKIQLLNLGLGISYNLAADSLRFSELGMSFRTAIGQILSIGGSGSFNLYQFQVDPRNPAIGRRVNKFLLSEGGKLAQLTNFGISVSTSFRGEKKKTTAGPVRTEADSLGPRARTGYIGLYDQEAPDFSIPWNLDLTWSYNQSQADPRFIFRGSNVSASLGFNLTEFWKFTATANYDLINKQFAAPQITVYRDLHCWELNFSWSPTGPYRYYRFEIRLKEPQLQDVKVTKQSSARNVY